MAKTGIYKRLVNGNLETFYFATVATAVDETANRKWLTAQQQTNLNTYLTTFNSANKLVKLDNAGKIPASLINADFQDYLKRDGTTTMTGNLDMNGKEVVNVRRLRSTSSSPTGSGNYLSINLDSADWRIGFSTGQYFHDAGIEVNGALSNVDDPTFPQDAVNKRWVESLVETGTKAVEAVVAATTGNITLSGLVTIDGVALKSGDRVLVKNQTTKTQNGIYIAKSGAWEKVVDDSKIGSLVFVTEGTVNNDSKWFSKVENEWIKFSQTDQLNYTGGLTRSGEYVRIANGGVTNTHLASGIGWYKLASSTVSDQIEDYVGHWGDINNYYENDMSLNEHLSTIYTMFKLVRGTSYSYTNNNQTIAGAYALASSKNSTRVGTEASPNTSGWVEGDVYIQII